MDGRIGKASGREGGAGSAASLRSARSVRAHSPPSTLGLADGSAGIHGWIERERVCV